MKFITPKFEIIEQAPGIKGMLEHIERAGRTCYRSEDKITEGSAEKFVERMKSLGHGSVLEHATVYLKANDEWRNLLIDFLDNKYSKYHLNENFEEFVTTNYRVLLQGDYDSWDEAVANGFNYNWLHFLKYQCEPTDDYEKRVTVRFNIDIGISREFNRHRVNSISEESTRYCNYSKGKFSRELSVVPPIRIRDNANDVLNEYRECYGNDSMSLAAMCLEVNKLAEHGEWDGSKESFNEIDTWLFAVLSAQWSYMRLTQQFDWQAQEARSILHLCTATELVHTAFVSDWLNFFQLRCDSHAHPMARELAIPLREEFTKRGLIKE